MAPLRALVRPAESVVAAAYWARINQMMEGAHTVAPLPSLMTPVRGAGGGHFKGGVGELEGPRWRRPPSPVSS